MNRLYQAVTKRGARMAQRHRVLHGVLHGVLDGSYAESSHPPGANKGG